MQGSVRMSYGRNPPFIAPPDREETEREQSNHETAGCPGHGPASGGADADGGGADPPPGLAAGADPGGDPAPHLERCGLFCPSAPAAGPDHPAGDGDRGLPAPAGGAPRPAYSLRGGLGPPQAADAAGVHFPPGQKNSGPGGAGRHQPDGSAARLHHPPSGIPRLALCGPDQRHRRPHSVCRFLRLSAGGTAEGLPPSAGGGRFFDVEAAPGGGQLPGGACPLDGLEAGDAGPGDDSPDLGPGGSGPGSGAAAGPGPGPGRHPAAPAAGGGGTPAAG